MKSIAIASVAFLAALSLGAAQQEPPPAAASPAEPAATATTTDETPSTPALVPLQPPVSSLAAAAKRANDARGKTKSRVSITNKTLAKKGGHLTMAVDSKGAPLPLPADPKDAAGKKGDKGAEKTLAEKDKKKADDSSAKKLAPAGNAKEGAPLDTDGDATNAVTTTATQPTTAQSQQPQDLTTTKPPL